MSTQFEQDLRHALATQAAELPDDASAELLTRGYDPCHAVGRTALILSAAALTAAALVAISLVGFGTDTPRAFAGWSATPTPAVGDQTQKALAECRTRLASLPGRVGRLPGGIPTIRAGGWHAVLVDTRGPYTMTVFQADHGRAVASCFAGSRGQGSLGAAIGVRPPAPVAPGHVSYASSGSNTTPANEGSRQFSRVIGRTGAGVTGVTVRLNDGTRVKATCANGWFLAWWPGSHGLSTTEVTTATGAS